MPLPACALCVCAALSWAVGNVCTRRAQAPRPVALLVWTSLVPPLPMPALSLAFEGPEAIGDALAGIDLGAVGAIGYLVLASTWFGYGAWSWLIRHNPASQVVPFTLLVPPVGIASAWLALDEVPNSAELVGGAIVLAGLALNAWPGSARRPRAAARSGGRRRRRGPCHSAGRGSPSDTRGVTRRRTGTD